jgi:HSP20 family molecular chaperone IbpA
MAETQDIEVRESEKQEVVESGAERTRARPAFIPRVDIYETDEAIQIVADVPGVDPDSVDITLEQGVLTINGFAQDIQPEGYALAYSEYSVGDYTRRFTLSNQIDQEGIEASVKDGVLRLHLPKAQPSTRKITVSSS